MQHLPVMADGSVELRSFLPEHVSSAYVGWLNDPETTRYTEARHCRHDMESARRYVEDAVCSPSAALWRICVDDVHVGNLRLSNINAVHSRADIAILIGAPEIRGQGIGTQAIKLATRCAFGDLGLQKLSAGIYVGNTASVRAFKKAGYREDAILSRHVIFDGQRTDVIQLVRFRDDIDHVA